MNHTTKHTLINIEDNSQSNFISFEHTLKKSLMHIENVTLDRDSYETKMMLGSEMPGIIPFVIRHQGECSVLDYEISSLKPLHEHFSIAGMAHKQIAALIYAMDALLDTMQSFLLSEDRVLLSPETIFLDESGGYHFVLLPAAHPSFSESLSALLLFILNHIDYTEDQAVITGYSLYHTSVRNPYFRMDDLLRIVDRKPLLKEDTTATKDIFRPENAGLKADNTSLLREAPVDYSPSVKELPFEVKASDHSPVKEQQDYRTLRFDSDYGRRDLPDPEADPDFLPEAEDLSPEEQPEKLFGFLDVPRKGRNKSRKKRNETLQEEQASQSLKKTVEKGKADKVLRNKVMLGIILMILIPLLVFLLKGPILFHKLLPVLIIVEVGVTVIMALDVLMSKLPEEE
ncbi:MAG: DUF6382 domain-containing protein [Oribacterium sp.]|jgi:hypothetical protein|nr:DUF6382 domain-containing protein [Oribacterium sp.]MDY6309329.1 DUF6382 domain-containing protein [Oribacterium sp.]MDY6316190.1 DUF6382 domain-containing protein [Oribacterium sp.]